ncbi:MAG: hypothetical protein LBR18_00030 [Tannerella sp.]|jgi:hypothetical protein|nr:hypothetical protein [Tannerella sp.]
MNEQRFFFEELKSRVGNVQLAHKIAETLDIGEDAAYRRLRGDTELSYSEIRKLAIAFTISMDDIMGLPSPYRKESFSLFNQDYFNLGEKDFRMSEDYIASIKIAAGNPQSVFGIATNTMPLHTRVLYPPLFKFFILKWMYLFGDLDKATPYSKIRIPERLLELHKNYSREITKIRYTYIIYQEDALDYIIKDIHYFHEIRLLSDDDVEELKNCLIKSTDNIEKTIIDRSFPNGNKVDFYVSELHFESSYAYLTYNNLTISMIDAFTTGSITSLNNGAGAIMKKWMLALKKTSTILSGSEKNRIAFIDKQRKLIGSL